MKPNKQDKPAAHGHTRSKAPAGAEEFSDENRDGPPPPADRVPAASEENRYRTGDRKDELPIGERRQQPRGGGEPNIKNESDDQVEEASEESFPASDPPSWTGSTAGAPETALDAPIRETPHQPATPRSVRKTRRRAKTRGRKGS